MLDEVFGKMDAPGTRQFVRILCWYGSFDEEIVESLALAGADGSLEVGPHGYPLGFMNVLAQHWKELQCQEGCLLCCAGARRMKASMSVALLV